MNPFVWAYEEASEKLNIAATWRELKGLGQKYGKRFMYAAIAWEIIEDVVLPVVCILAGVPWLAPVFLVLHFEPIVYPIFFKAFRTYDRMKGLEPWEPDRSAQSTMSRASLKQLTYRLLSLTVFLIMLGSANLSGWILTGYTVLMALFGLVHDRIWHDSNYDIDEDDNVGPKRVFWKVTTYRFVSALVMFPLFKGLGLVLMPAIAYQGTMFILHIFHEGVWAKSTYGIVPVERKV